jgi:multidrug resistance efflux pump
MSAAEHPLSARETSDPAIRVKIVDRFHYKIFTWVRLAQRISVRIHLDEVPPGVVLSAGMTATVDIEDRTRVPGNVDAPPAAKAPRT